MAILEMSILNSIFPLLGLGFGLELGLEFGLELFWDWKQNTAVVWAILPPVPNLHVATLPLIPKPVNYRYKYK